VLKADFTEPTHKTSSEIDLLNEVKMLSSLGRHENIVGFIGMFLCGADSEFAQDPASACDPAIALECLDGTPLSTH
ncbi:hypothetical protein T484DRAFT_1834116, partial [Baffinella frigidus]